MLPNHYYILTTRINGRLRDAASGHDAMSIVEETFRLSRNVGSVYMISTILRKRKYQLHHHILQRRAVPSRKRKHIQYYFMEY